MSFSFASMIRLVALSAVGATMMAVGLARLAPPEPTRRVARPITAHNINDYALRVADRQPRWLDSGSGAVSVTPLPGNDVLESASCSPWTDRDGGRQVVGRWSNRTYQGPETVAHEFGLARFSFPDGTMIDHVALETVPIAPPCWFPGDRARVLFLAGDGQVYRFDFESDDPAVDPATRPGIERAPTPIVWGCPRPGVGEVYITDLHWPQLPGLGRHLLASLRLTCDGPGRGRTLSGTQLWWLELDEAGTRIAAAGPLLTRDGGPAPADHRDDRNPVAAALPDGSLALAFARQTDGPTGWSIRLGTLAVDPATRRPSCRESQTRAVDDRSQPGLLAFSPDGRWLNTLVVEPETDPIIGRFATAAPAVARREAPPRTR